MIIKIAAVVVLYNPDRNFIGNIYSYLDFVSLLVIVDNSEKPNLLMYSKLLEDRRVKSIINYENKGIAEGINKGIKVALENNFDWVLAMDQDSFFKKNMIEKYLNLFFQIKDTSGIAVIGPVFEKKKETHEINQFQQVSSLITSGSLIHTGIFAKTGGYNEKLFIDEVDHEYCFRVQLSGYRILQLEEVFLEHSLGQKILVKTLMGENKNKTLHSPVRLYYMVRNCCYVISKYKKQFPAEIKLKRKDLVVRIKNNLLYGDKKFSTLKHVMLGYLDYKLNRFGKLKGH